jgi:hypothetical protein
MPAPEIEEFAKLLVKEVRDRAILSCDSRLKKCFKGPIAKRWRANLRDKSSRDLAKSMIPDCIDDALFYLLYAIDSGVLRLSFTASNGNVVDLTTDGLGELAGWLAMGKGGWKSHYSQQRFVDDFEDLE